MHMCNMLTLLSCYSFDDVHCGCCIYIYLLEPSDTTHVLALRCSERSDIGIELDSGVSMVITSIIFLFLYI